MLALIHCFGGELLKVRIYAPIGIGLPGAVTFREFLPFQAFTLVEIAART
jgi:hypothetical protein